MAFVNTVLGKIKPEDMGVTYGHDHLLFCPPAPFNTQDADMQLLDVDTAIREVGHYKTAGGHSIVEMSTVEMGRSPGGLRAISKATGVQIVAVTGFNKGKFCDPFVADKSVDQIAERMVNDLTRGMDDTTIQAGVIKASSSKGSFTPGEEKIFQAAARAHLQTGAPISTHTEGGTMALEQIKRLTDSGVKPQHITIGHLDLNLDWEYLLSVAQAGVFMGFDQVGKEKYAPDAKRIKMIKCLAENGHATQLILSGDLARMSYWPSYGFGNGPGFTHILWRFVPLMIEAGITREVIDHILISNPARAFTWVQ